MIFKFSTLLCGAGLIATAYAAPLKRDVDPALVPEFGVQAGVNPSGTGNCDGITNASGQVVKIPCSCPPARNDFLQSLNANVAAGKAVNNPSVALSFPTDNSKTSQLARIEAAIVTLQNLKGPGVGCPAASTTFVAQRQVIQDSNNDSSAPPLPPPTPLPPAAPSPPATSPSPPSQTPAGGGVDPALVPEFGFQAGLNPTGTGDCDGIKNDAGQVVKIPCACPPDRNFFINTLSANIAAGEVVNNPSVKISFPTDNSNQSKAARIIASLATLQNLNGPGKGCPAVSTTFSAQLKALQE